MDLAEIFRVMRRRWKVLLPGLLLTAALTAAVALTVPVTYQSQSTVVLLNSQKATVAYDGNPFLSTQTSLTGMADSLARNLNSDGSLRELKSRGANGTFEAKLADNAQGPLMWLTVTGDDKAGVLSADRILTTYAQERLEQFQRQQRVDPKAMIRMTTIVPPQDPVAQTKTRLEYMIMAGGLGLVLSLVAVFFMEARRRPRAERPARPAQPTPGETVVEQTMALRTSPSWSRAADNRPTDNRSTDGRSTDTRSADGRSAETRSPDARSATEPRAGRSVMTVESAAEPLDEESAHGQHGQRPHTGQRHR
ncbi:Wzz/FepE/Etk N-terminal domain-containing protein [Streptomyces sp. NPDC028635]|uniref:Wzz/FepE/Etk N-terminal domain-containing protein n=1 Tax=Streptomyces sp. NPDC028635 TaxID=3154800 RepID=UPI0033CEDE85